MTQEHFLLNEVAKKIGRKPFQIVYMIVNGFVDEPKLRIGGKRIFNRKDIEEIRRVMDQKYGTVETNG